MNKESESSCIEGVKHNPRQLQFIAEFLATDNAIKSVISAGYNESSAKWQAAALLRNPSIKQAIAEAKADPANQRPIPLVEVTANARWQVAYGKDSDNPQAVRAGNDQLIKLGQHDLTPDKPITSRLGAMLIDRLANAERRARELLEGSVEVKVIEPPDNKHAFPGQPGNTQRDTKGV